MERRDAFSERHPAVLFLFFCMAPMLPMFSMEPSCLLISFASASAYCFRLQGGKAFRSLLLGALPLALFAAAVNCLFSRRGETVLFALPSGGALTLESLLYGGAAGLLLAGTFAWFSCCGTVLSPDKLLGLFGGRFPSLCLVLSMALGMVPRFRKQLRAVGEAQRSLGRDPASGGLIRRVKSAVSLFSILVTWVLENAVETADSMRGRGYGLPGRTSYSPWRFRAGDGVLLAWLLSCGLFLLGGLGAGGFAWNWYPAAKGTPATPLTVSLRLSYLAFCLTPLCLDLWEARLWARSQSGERAKGGEGL